ncbi:hypothetical protein FS837_004603 [Tulasnella sp. UAMH 9824]|nr:hypothetical protein FS837_004603 [Tulasnella sp. UAMH 9824]
MHVVCPLGVKVEGGGDLRRTNCGKGLSRSAVTSTGPPRCVLPGADFVMTEEQQHQGTRKDYAPDQWQEHPSIDLFPMELLQSVISLGAYDPEIQGPRIKWVCRWRRVSREWKDAIDMFPLLWSSIVIKDRTEHVKTQLQRSKGAPLNIWILSLVTDLPDHHWIQPVVDNVHRWKSVMFHGYPEEIVARLESRPSVLEAFGIERAGLPDDCKLFNLVKPNLRKLSLSLVNISHRFDPPLGLEELHLHTVVELGEDGKFGFLSTNKVRQFLQKSPNLRILLLEGPSRRSPNDHELRPIALPKLEEVSTVTSQVLHLFYAENCLKFSTGMKLIQERPPLSSWVTFARVLRRVDRLKITVEDDSLNFEAVAEPYEVGLGLCRIGAGFRDCGRLVCSILEDILDEVEKDQPISAHVELALLTTNRSGSGFDVGLAVLELLQIPVSGASSSQVRWRIPNLDTLDILEQGVPFEALKTFVQTRSTGHCMEAATPITGIFCRSGFSGSEGYHGYILDEVMAHTAGGNDG